MYFELFLTFEGVEFNCYGPYVAEPENDNRVKYYVLDKAVEGYLVEDVDDLDNKCNALLDYGDVDYFDTEKCIKLNDWIKERLTKPIDNKYRQALEVLKLYCEQAIERKTGIMIEL